LGVANQTVRNHISEVESRWEVKSIDIGKTTAYYVSDKHRSKGLAESGVNRTWTDSVKDRLYGFLNVYGIADETESDFLKGLVRIWPLSVTMLFFGTVLYIALVIPMIFIGLVPFAEFVGIRNLLFYVAFSYSLTIVGFGLMVPSFVAQMAVLRPIGARDWIRQSIQDQ
jgi:hypothetical protein